MTLGLILAIIELIMKIPDIIAMIKEILDAIHSHPLHLHIGLLLDLESKVAEAHMLADAGQPATAHTHLRTFRDHLKTA